MDLLLRYQSDADALVEALAAGDSDARWRVKWEHPAFCDKGADDVATGSLGPDDARLVIARGNGFEDWQHLVSFTEALAADPAVQRFEAAADAIVAGDLAALQSMLRDDPELIRRRSTRRHHATLLHYVGANGVENVRQKTPPNIVRIAETLIDAGADVDATADMYGEKCTTMSMLVSSSPPAEAGGQAELAELLVDRGARLEGAGSKWQSALMTALMFGFIDTAKALRRRGARVDNLPAAAGLGDAAAATALLRGADARDRHAALALASQHGHVEIVELLLDAGEDPDRYNPEGLHAHSTPMHQAVAAGHMSVVRRLAERGARLDIADRIYKATPYDWAVHGGEQEVAAYLKARQEWQP